MSNFGCGHLNHIITATCVRWVPDWLISGKRKSCIINTDANSVLAGSTFVLEENLEPECVSLLCTTHRFWRSHYSYFSKSGISIRPTPAPPSPSPRRHNVCTRSLQLLMSLLITLSAELMASPAVFRVPGAAVCSGKRCSLAMFDFYTHYSLGRVRLGTTVLESEPTTKKKRKKENGLRRIKDVLIAMCLPPQLLLLPLFLLNDEWLATQLDYPKPETSQAALDVIIIFFRNLV